MQFLPAISLLLLTLSLLSPTPTGAHNITKILAKHPEFSTFNHYLTATHLAAEINRRLTITVCAVDNSGMSDILSKHLSLPTLKNVLSLHIFSDYFGAKKLHQITGGTTLTATMFQATGHASGTSGYVNITDSKGGKVSFGPEDNDGTLNSVYIKSVEEIPYNISVIHISHVITSPEAEAPTAGPAELNITTIMAKQGCKAFSDLIFNTDAEKLFTTNLEGGLTVFCPSDDALNGFMPEFKNLTDAGKESLMLYHGVPVYNSMGMLKSNNGLMNTLATDGAKKYDFTVQNDGEKVKLKTRVVTATILGTLVDEEPLSVYKIDRVLLPRELFKTAPPEAPAPAPKPARRKGKGKKEADEVAAPGPDGSDEDPADQTASDNGAVIGGGGGGRLFAAVLAVCVGVLALL